MLFIYPKKPRIKQRSNKIQITFHKIYGIGIRQSTVGTVVKKTIVYVKNTCEYLIQYKHDIFIVKNSKVKLSNNKEIICYNFN